MNNYNNNNTSLAFAPTTLPSPYSLPPSTIFRPLITHPPSTFPNSNTIPINHLSNHYNHNHNQNHNINNNINNNFSSSSSHHKSNHSNNTRRFTSHRFNDHKRNSGHNTHQNNDNTKSLANLHELTERIADLLQVGSIHKNNIHCPKDAPLGYLTANTHVVVIFGKHLIRDQITVEYAKRIVTFIKQIASNSINPDIICFTGGKGINHQSSISEASAGYAFFRAICEEVNLDVSKFEYILEEKSVNTKQNLDFVIDTLRSKLGSDCISTCHFTLVSSDYHLIRMQEIHRLSPRQSMLFPLECSMNTTWNCIFAAYPFCVSRDAGTAFLGRAIVLANDLGIILVNLNGAIEDREFVSNENIHRLNETFAKMREMYRVIDATASSISINKNNNNNNKDKQKSKTNFNANFTNEFQNNYSTNNSNRYINNSRLKEERNSFIDGSFHSDMRTHAETVELAIHDLREIQTILNPLLQDVGSSISREDLHRARKLLKSTVARIRTSMDPDRILRVSDRLAIIDDMTSYIEQENRQFTQSGLSCVIPSNSSKSSSSKQSATNPISPVSTSSLHSSPSIPPSSPPDEVNTLEDNIPPAVHEDEEESEESGVIENEEELDEVPPSTHIPTPSKNRRSLTSLSSFSSRRVQMYPSNFYTSPSLSSPSLSYYNNPNLSGQHFSGNAFHNGYYGYRESDLDEEFIGGETISYDIDRFRYHRDLQKQSNEDVWQGRNVQFEGNGKKIALDGPNVVITSDNPLPPPPPLEVLPSSSPPSVPTSTSTSSSTTATSSRTSRKKRTTTSTRRTSSVTSSRARTSTSSSSDKSNNSTKSKSSSMEGESGTTTVRRRSSATRKRQTSTTSAKTKRKNSIDI